MSTTSPTSINVERTFIDFLMARGVLEVAATELYSRHERHLSLRINNSLASWGDLGGIRPVASHPDQPGRLVCWRNPRFDQLTGYPPVGEAVAAAYEWIERNGTPAFLLPALCYLRAIGCDRIFVTDGPDDEGIDCIGRIGFGGLRSTLVFVQAKSGRDFVSGEQFGSMYTRYASLPNTPAYGRYLTALGVPQSQDGLARIFVVACRAQFKEGARRLAWRTGTLIRSGRMLAAVLGEYYPAGSLDALSERFVLPVGANLDRDLASELIPDS